jgi:hypothetical protein
VVLRRFRTAVTSINGGVFLLRPCAAVEAHMQALLKERPKLRFTHHTAEQDFFGWYYRYTGVTLPLQYNAQAEQSLLPSGLTGAQPCVACGAAAHPLLLTLRVAVCRCFRTGRSQADPVQ